MTCSKVLFRSKQVGESKLPTKSFSEQHRNRDDAINSQCYLSCPYLDLHTKQNGMKAGNTTDSMSAWRKKLLPKWSWFTSVPPGEYRDIHTHTPHK